MLAKQIARQGVIPFENFMEQALYCPDLGYYERDAASIGRAGDFFTSVSVGPLFGRLLAGQFARWLVDLDGPVRLVEAGAHDGRLACDILTALRDEHPSVFTRVELCLLEPSARRRAWQAETLRDFADRVTSWTSWADAEAGGGVRGVIYANELLDAFPVRRLGWDSGARRWFEWGVRWADNGFQWARMPVPEAAETQRALAHGGIVVPPELGAVLPDGFTVELAPRATEWWRQAARALRCGRLLTLDYGREGAEFLQPERGAGTLRAFHRHHQVPAPLASPGEQDLTADVNFTALRAAGEEAGLTTDGLVTQERFIAGLMREVAGVSDTHTKWTPQDSRRAWTLLHPEHLGRAFRVLTQSRRG